MGASRIEDSPGTEAVLPRIVGVQFRRAAAVLYDFDAGTLELPTGTRVVVETEKGEALGWTVGAPDRRPAADPSVPLRRILRLVDARDMSTAESQQAVEHEALRFFARRIRELSLPMKPVTCEWSHSGEKATFYFVSEDRVDFRTLVRDLAQRYRLRVELRQLKPREDAKILGAMGPCGRETCCSSWLRAFTPVSIKMARDQGLALNPNRVTGVCGRLLCCLAYEQETYAQMRKQLPRVGRAVRTPRGPGKIIDVLVLRRRVRVALEEGGPWVDFGADEVQPLDPSAPQPPEESDGDEATDAFPARPTRPARPLSAPRPGMSTDARDATRPMSPRPTPTVSSPPAAPPRAPPASIDRRPAGGRPPVPSIPATGPVRPDRRSPRPENKAEHRVDTKSDAKTDTKSETRPTPPAGRTGQPRHEKAEKASPRPTPAPNRHAGRPQRPARPATAPAAPAADKGRLPESKVDDKVSADVNRPGRHQRPHRRGPKGEGGGPPSDSSPPTV